MMLNAAAVYVIAEHGVALPVAVFAYMAVLTWIIVTPMEDE